jgi:hypothetical protein
MLNWSDPETDCLIMEERRVRGQECEGRQA